MSDHEGSDDGAMSYELRRDPPCAGKDTEGALAELGSHCGAVVICRASPSQKAAIVSMMDEFELRRAGGRQKGWLGWWNRINYGLKVSLPCAMMVHCNRQQDAAFVCLFRTAYLGATCQ